MILTEIQSYLAKQGKAELAIYFRSDTNAIRPMLKHLIRKGRIRLMNNQKCCGCTSCTPESLEFYEWIN